MKAALIPPIPALKRFGQGQFHLLLSHLLDDDRYSAHYKMQRKRGAYLVLDNSAHENGKGDDPEQLMWKACAINAQEVVVPDVLFDCDGTIEGALSAQEAWYEKRPSPSDIVRQKALMYVPQGKTYEAWQTCLRNLVSIHLYNARRYSLKRSFVIGLSKDYEIWEGGLLRMIDQDLFPLKDSLHKRGIWMHVHLLGWGRDLWALEEIAQQHKWIRSTDSAKPFVYGLRGIVLNPEEPAPEYPRRPEDYFEKRIGGKAYMASAMNSLLFRAIASGSRSNTAIV